MRNIQTTASAKVIAINFASKKQLMKIPGMQSWVAEVILLVRKNSGNITNEYLQLLTKGNLTPEAYAVMNFSSNKDLPAKQMLNCVHNTAAKQSDSGTHNAKRCHSDRTGQVHTMNCLIRAF